MQTLPISAHNTYIIQPFGQGLLTLFQSKNILIVPTVRRVEGTGISAGMFCVARLCEYHSAVTHVSHLLPPPPNMKFEEWCRQGRGVNICSETKVIGGSYAEIFTILHLKGAFPLFIIYVAFVSLVAVLRPTSDSILSSWMRNGVGNRLSQCQSKGWRCMSLSACALRKKWYTKHYPRRLWFPINTFDPPRWTMSCVSREMLTPSLVFYLDLPYSCLFNCLRKACCTHRCIKATPWIFCILK